MIALIKNIPETISMNFAYMNNEHLLNDVFRHIIAETLTFKDDSLSLIAERVARSHDSLDRQEIDKLTKMAAMMSKAIAQKILTRANMLMATDASGNLAFTTVLSKLASLKARSE